MLELASEPFQIFRPFVEFSIRPSIQKLAFLAVNVHVQKPFDCLICCSEIAHHSAFLMLRGGGVGVRNSPVTYWNPPVDNPVCPQKYRYDTEREVGFWCRCRGCKKSSQCTAQARRIPCGHKRRTTANIARESARGSGFAVLCVTTPPSGQRRGFPSFFVRCQGVVRTPLLECSQSHHLFYAPIFLIAASLSRRCVMYFIAIWYVRCPRTDEHCPAVHPAASRRAAAA